MTTDRRCVVRCTSSGCFLCSCLCFEQCRQRDSTTILNCCFVQWQQVAAGCSSTAVSVSMVAKYRPYRVTNKGRPHCNSSRAANTKIVWWRVTKNLNSRSVLRRQSCLYSRPTMTDCRHTPNRSIAWKTSSPPSPSPQPTDTPSPDYKNAYCMWNKRSALSKPPRPPF